MRKYEKPEIELIELANRVLTDIVVGSGDVDWNNPEINTKNSLNVNGL